RHGRLEPRRTGRTAPRGRAEGGRRPTGRSPGPRPGRGSRAGARAGNRAGRRGRPRPHHPPGDRLRNAPLGRPPARRRTRRHRPQAVALQPGERGMNTPRPPAAPPATLHIRFFRTADGAPVGADRYEQLLHLLAQFTPVIEALPPDAALADVRGALRYFDRDAPGIAELIRLRALAWYGIRCTIGIGANPLLARMAPIPIVH